jgi:hypothetical protein
VNVVRFCDRCGQEKFMPTRYCGDCQEAMSKEESREIKNAFVLAACVIAVALVVCALVGCGQKEPELATEFQPAALDKRITDLDDKIATLFSEHGSQHRINENVQGSLKAQREQLGLLSEQQADTKSDVNELLARGDLTEDLRAVIKRADALEKQLAELKKRRCPCSK